MTDGWVRLSAPDGALEIRRLPWDWSPPGVAQTEADAMRPPTTPVKQEERGRG